MARWWLWLMSVAAGAYAVLVLTWNMILPTIFGAAPPHPTRSALTITVCLLFAVVLARISDDG